MLNSTLNPILQTAIADVTARLNTFAQDPLFAEKMALVFGSNGVITPNTFLNIIRTELINIEIQQASHFYDGIGGFSTQANIVYLSDILLKQGQSEQLTAALLQSVGYYLDAYLNTVDTNGAEGELFSDIVRGFPLSSADLIRLKSNDYNDYYGFNGIPGTETITPIGRNWSASGSYNDNLGATLGNDLYTMTSGSDFFADITGDDTVVGTLDDCLQWDTIVGGEGTDTLIITDGTTTDSVMINLSAKTDQILNFYSVFYGFERFNFGDFLGTVDFIGSTGDDWIKLGKPNYLPSQFNVVLGDAGNDTVIKSNKDSHQKDIIVGGDGVDALILTDISNTGIITINLNNTDNQLSTITDATISGFENFDFSDFAGTVNFTGSNGNDGIKFGLTSGVPNQSDIIFMGNGDDTVGTSFRNLQQNDVIDGGLGTDTLMISEGNSVSNLVVNVNNTINQLSSVTGTQVVNFERFDLSNFLGTLTFTGSNSNDWVKAGKGNDTLDGGLGADQLMGGLGNDTYIVDNIRDSVTENGNEGNDLVQSTVNTTLTNNVENLTLLGTANLYGTGNNLDNTLTGNSGANLLKGLNGNDTLLGGAGNDTLIGGLGNDRLTGGEGNDQFLFGSGSAFKSSNLGVDTLTDFTTNSDKIALSKVTFNALSSPLGTLQSAEFVQINSLSNELSLVGSSSAKMVYNVATGNLFYNPDGAIAGLSNGGQFATLSSRPNLSATDFFVQS